MHVDHLTISSAPAHNGGDHDQSILRHKVSYASFILRTVTGLRNEFEFQGVGQAEEEEKGRQAEE